MIVEIIFTVGMIIVYWYFNIRIVSHRSLPQLSSSEASARCWDFIVIGGGVSGAAAIAGIRDKHPKASVLLIEGGKVNDGSMVPLPNYTMDLVGSEVDWLFRAGRPFAEEVPGSPVGSTPPVGSDVRNMKQGMKPYPRGKGFGGTQQLDHQLWFSPIVAHSNDESIVTTTAEKSVTQPPSKRWTRAEAWLSGLLMKHQLVSFAAMRSPISMAFSVTARDSFGSRIQPMMPPPPTEDVTVKGMKPNHVFPHYLFLDAQRGTRPIVARYVLDDVLHVATTDDGGVRTLSGMTVVGFEQAIVKGHRVVVGVQCRRTGMTHDATPLVHIPVGRAVVCCAGNFGSARIIAPLLTSPRRREEDGGANHGERTMVTQPPSAPSTTFPLVDVVSVPLIYQARPGLTDDPLRTQSFANIFAWYVARKGGLLQVVTDTSVLLSSQKVAGASILISLFPFGGFSSRQRLAKMGFAPVLGVFTEAFHFQIAIHTLPSSRTPFAEGKAEATKSALSTFRYSSNDEPTEQFRAGLFAGMTLSPIAPELSDDITACLVEGVEFCRLLVTRRPIADLTTGREAVDTSLFPSAESGQLLQALYGNVSGMRREAVETMRKNTAKRAESPEYLKAYVQRHARYAGYASGSLSHVVSSPPRSTSVAGQPSSPCAHLTAEGAPENVYIGDVSTVSPRDSFFHGLHNAGATSTAMLRGYAAGTEAAISP